MCEPGDNGGRKCLPEEDPARVKTDLSQMSSPEGRVPSSIPLRILMRMRVQR